MSRRTAAENKLRSTLICVGAMLSLGATSQGGVIFSNLDGSNDYTKGGGQTVGGTGSSLGGYYAIAEAFTPGANVSVGQIDIALSFFGEGTDSDAATVSLSSDSAGLPGTVLESWSLSDLPAFNSTNSTLQQLLPTSALNLTGGDQYWVVATPGASNTLDAWNVNDIGSSETTARDFGSGWGLSGTPAAFEVLTDSPAPEPGTASLLAIAGLAVLVGVTRRTVQRRQ